MSFRPQRVQMSFAPMIDLANSTPSVAGTAFNALGKGLVDLGVRKKNQQTAQAQAAKEKAELETQRAYNKIINPKFGKEFEVAKKNNPNIDMGLIKLSPPKAETWQKPIIDGSGEFVSMSNLGNVKKLDLSPKKPTRSIQTRDIRVKGVNYIAKYNPANDRFENTWQKSANQPSQKSTNNEIEVPSSHVNLHDINESGRDLISQFGIPKEIFTSKDGKHRAFGYSKKKLMEARKKADFTRFMPDK